MAFNCNRCRLSETRKNIVIGKGKKPNNYLIIGDGISSGEETLKEPFIGQTGRLLTSMLEKANIDPDECYFTNIVLCRPTNKKNGPNRSPRDDEKISCAYNIMQIEEEVSPKRVILIGKDVQEFYIKTFPDAIYIFNMDFILKNGGVKSPYFMNCVRKLKDSLDEEKIDSCF